VPQPPEDDADLSSEEEPWLEKDMAGGPSRPGNSEERRNERSKRRVRSEERQ